MGLLISLSRHKFNDINFYGITQLSFLSQSYLCYLNLIISSPFDQFSNYE